jgi:D-3-phosphoglycerate dehydrogenase
VTRIALLDDYQHVAETMAEWAPVRARAELTVLHEPLGGEDAVVSALAGFDIIGAMRDRTTFSRAVIERLPRLRFLTVTGPYCEKLDMGAANDCGVIVSATGGADPGDPRAAQSAYATPELTWALILAVTRHVAQEDRVLRAGGWQHSMGRVLRGRTLGVVGLGNIGKIVAGYARAFGMQVIAWSPNLTDARAAAAGARAVDKETLFRESDVVTVHLKPAPSVIGAVSAHEISLMKPDAILVNTSRGALIDEAAMIAALQAGRIARRRARRVQPGASAARPSAAAPGDCRGDPAHRLCRGRTIPDLLRPDRREHPRLPGWRPDPGDQPDRGPDPAAVAAAEHCVIATGKGEGMTKPANQMTTEEVGAALTRGGPSPLIPGTPLTEASRDFLFANIWKSALSWREKRLISLTCTAVAAHRYPLEIHLYAALKSGDFAVDELHDWALHLAAYAGFPFGAGAETVLKTVCDDLAKEGASYQETRAPSVSTPDVRKMSGQEIAQYVTQTAALPLEGDNGVTRASHAFLFAQVWTSELSWREKRLISLTCTAIAAYAMPFETHLHAALKSGDLSEDDLHAFALHVAAYAGFPFGAGAEATLKQVIAGMDAPG